MCLFWFFFKCQVWQFLDTSRTLIIHNWESTQTKKLWHKCSHQRYSQLPRVRNSQNDHGLEYKSKMCYAHTVRHYLATKKKSRHMLQCELTLKISHTAGRTRPVIPFTWNTQSRRIPRDFRDLWLPKVGEQQWGVLVVQPVLLRWWKYPRTR